MGKLGIGHFVSIRGVKQRLLSTYEEIGLYYFIMGRGEVGVDGPTK